MGKLKWVYDFGQGKADCNRTMKSIILWAGILLIAFTNIANAQWSFSGVFPDSTLLTNGVHGIAVDAEGKVWIGPYNSRLIPAGQGNVEERQNFVRVLFADGSEAPFSPIIGVPFEGSLLRFGPITGLNQDNEGNIWVSSHGFRTNSTVIGGVWNQTRSWIHKFAPSGQHLASREVTIMRTGTASHSPNRVAISADGNKIFVSYVFPGTPIKIYSGSDLSEIGIVTDSKMGFSRTLDVSPDGKTVFSPGSIFTSGAEQLYISQYINRTGSLEYEFSNDTTLARGMSPGAIHVYPANPDILYVTADGAGGGPAARSPWDSRRVYGISVSTRLVVDSLEWNYGTRTDFAIPRSMAITADGRTMYLGTFSSGTPAVQKFQIPVLRLLEPANNDITIRTPDFKWSKPYDSVSSTFILSNDSTFSSDYVSIVTTDTIISGLTPLRRGQTYYWKVKAQLSDGTEWQSVVNRFIVGAPRIKLSTNEINFGSILTNSRPNKGFFIKNTGSDDLTINEISSMDERVSIDFNSSVTVGIGDSALFNVTVTSSVDGLLNSWVQITEVGGIRDSLRLIGVIGTPKLLLSSDSLNFGSERLGNLRSLPLVLTNVGTDTLIVSSIRSLSAAFSTKQRSFRLLPGEMVVDSIQFAPKVNAPSHSIILYEHRYGTDTLRVSGNIAPLAVSLSNKRIIVGEFKPTNLVELSAVGSSDPDGGVLSYQWINNVTNQVISSERDLKVNLNVGTSNLMLIVQDSQDATDTSRVRIDVISFAHKMKSSVVAGLTAFGNSDSFQLYIGDISFNPEFGSSVIRMNKELSPIFSLTVPQSLQTATSVSADSSVYISNGSNLSGFSSFGLELWSTKGLGAIASATPTIDTKRSQIYMGVSNRNFFAFNYLTGISVWAFFADAPISASAVITRDDKLIFPTQKGTLYGFDLHRNLSGTSVTPTWISSNADSVFHSPAIDKSDNIVVGTANGVVRKLFFESAGLINTVWESKVCNGITASPVIDADGAIFVVCKEPSLVKLDPVNGSLIWSVPLDGKVVSTPAISDYETIYVATTSGVLYALVSSTGAKRWSFDNSGSSIVSDILHVKGTTYLGTSDGFVYAFFDAGGQLNSNMTKSGESEGNEIGAQEPQWGTFMGNVRRTGYAGDFSSVVNIEDGKENEIPTQTSLRQNYPNPFNPTTVISYQLSVSDNVRLAVYDILGRQVAILANGNISAGSHQVTFDASGLASGMYIYRLEAGGEVFTRRMTLVK